MASLAKPRVTFEEYLDAEKIVEYKSEYRGGEIFAVSGGSSHHSELCVRMTSILSAAFLDCKVYSSDLNLRLEQFDKGVYLDGMMVCGAPVFWKNRTDVILNPSLVVEVLSPSTATYDLGIKIFYYHSIPSLQQVLVSQDSIRVSLYTRTEVDN